MHATLGIDTSGGSWTGRFPVCPARSIHRDRGRQTETGGPVSHPRKQDGPPPHGNFRLLHRPFTQIDRIMKINGLSVVTNDVIAAARSTLVIGEP